MVEDLRLTTVEMAHFAARGFLRFDGVVPDVLNARFIAEAREDRVPPNPAGMSLCDCYEGSVVREILALPKIQAIIESLVGPDPRFDHHGKHFAWPEEKLRGLVRTVVSQPTHQDSTIDPRDGAFDLQLFYFPQEVTPEMGGTRFIPGTHLRIVSETAIARYQNILGQQKVVCPAGSVFAMHHGMWHGGEVNRSDDTRFMLKVRLNPTVPQVRLWNTADWTPEQAAPQPIFDRNGVADPANDVQSILCSPEPWFEQDTGRLEFMNRIRFWRHLIGDPDFDAQHWWTRVENQPGSER